VPRPAAAGPRAQIDVTPMVDVMLVLLIIFMIVTPLVASGVRVLPPAARHADGIADDAETLTLALDSTGAYTLNRRPIAPEEFVPRLHALLAAQRGGTGERVLYFEADRSLPYARVEQAVEQARSAGVRVLAAITVRKG
jgi:biopolymer transport protein ExbD